MSNYEHRFILVKKKKQEKTHTHTQDLRNQFTLYELYSNLLAKDYCGVQLEKLRQGF